MVGVSKYSGYMINTKLDGVSCIETNNKNGRETTKETIKKLHDWIYNHPQVVESPFTNAHDNIKYHITSEVIKTKTYLYTNKRNPQLLN